MGVAYSDGSVVYTTVRCDATHLLADLDALLLSVGWTHTAITGGWKYTITSPQGYQAKVKIWDTGALEGSGGGWHFLSLQVLTFDEAHSGYLHPLAYGRAGHTTYEVVAGQCQLFLAEPGNSDVAGVNSVALGIPYIGDPGGADCAGGDDAAVTSCWWSCGADAADSSEHLDFRNSRWCQRSYSYCLNGTVTIGINQGAYDGGLKIYPLTPTNDVDNWYGIPPRVVKYSSGDPLYIEPLVGWDFRVRGQLWDSIVATRDEPLDSILTTVQTDDAGGTVTSNWVAWNYRVGDGFGGIGTYFATLYLLTAKATRVVANYAY